ncbi:hypothetical protein MJC1_03994 [Methylocystis sp. MJC1]|nr:hypothetical protein MJC1_03994 [Methylocystis sp. MJC1]
MKRRPASCRAWIIPPVASGWGMIPLVLVISIPQSFLWPKRKFQLYGHYKSKLRREGPVWVKSSLPHRTALRQKRSLRPARNVRKGTLLVQAEASALADSGARMGPANQEGQADASAVGCWTPTETILEIGQVERYSAGCAEVLESTQPPTRRQFRATRVDGKKRQQRQFHAEDEAPDREARWMALLRSGLQASHGRRGFRRRWRNHARRSIPHLRRRGGRPAL